MGFGGISIWSLLLILAIVILLFGAKRIPDLARGLGQGIRNFRSGMRDEPDGDGGEGGEKTGSS